MSRDVEAAEQKLRTFLTTDRLGRFLYPGWMEFEENNPASSQSRWNASTIYANLLLWKPLVHALVNMSQWGAYAITLMRDKHPVVGADRWTIDYETLIGEYNRNLPDLLVPVLRADLDTQARAPISLIDLKRLWDFCHTPLGQKIAPLKYQFPPAFLKNG